MEEEQECFRTESWEGTSVSVEAQPLRDSTRPGHSFLLGPKWLQVAVAVPHNSAQPCPGPWPAASVPVATGLGAGAVCQPWSGLNVHLSSLKRGQE